MDDKGIEWQSDENAIADNTVTNAAAWNDGTLSLSTERARLEQDALTAARKWYVRMKRANSLLAEGHELRQTLAALVEFEEKGG